MTNGNFANDLKLSQNAVHRWMYHLDMRDYACGFNETDGNDGGVDCYAENLITGDITTFDVKHDHKYQDTGRLPIEDECVRFDAPDALGWGHKPRADYIVFINGDTWWLVPSQAIADAMPALKADRSVRHVSTTRDDSQETWNYCLEPERFEEFFGPDCKTGKL